MARCVVVGGGISGLSAAYYLNSLTEKFSKIILLESSNRLGGWMKSVRDDAIYEKGPRSLRPAGVSGRNTLSLLEELDLENDIIPVLPSNPAARKRYIYTNGNLNELPNGFVSMFRTTAPFTKPLVHNLWKEWSVEKSDLTDESVHDFFGRRLGSEIADYIANPLIRGIFSGDSKKLSMKSCFPDVYNLEQEHGSIVKSVVNNISGKKRRSEDTSVRCDLEKRALRERWSIYSFRGGMQQISDKLEQQLMSTTDVDVMLNTKCKSIDFKDGKAMISTDNEVIEADHVVSSIYAPDLSKLLTSDHHDFRGLLNSISSASVAVINVEFQGEADIPQGFGYLIPSFENGPLLGVTFDSCMFPQHDNGKNTRLTVMMGGAWYEEIKDYTVLDFEQAAMDALHDQLSVTTPIKNISVTLQKNCIPQYLVGHSMLTEKIDDYLSSAELPLKLIGSSYRGVSINDCIHNAKLGVQDLCR